MIPLYRTKLFWRQFFSLFGLTAFFFGSMGLAIISRTSAAIAERQLEVSAAYRMQVVKHLEDWLEERRSDVAWMGRELSADLKKGDWDAPAARDRLARFVESKSSFIDAFIVGPDGYIVASKTAAGERRIFVGDRDYVKAARDGELYVSGYFRGRLTGSASFAIAIPIWGPRGIGAVLAGIISLSELTAIVDGIGLADLGIAYVVDGSRHLVSNPEFAGAFKKSQESAAEFLVDSLPAREIEARRSGSARYRDVSGDLVFGSYQWIESLKLGLVVELGAKRAFRPVTSLLEFALLLAAALLSILILIAWGLSARLLGPIAALIEAAQGVMEDRFDGPIEIATGTEIDQLVEAFNRMAERIRERESGLRESAARDSLTGLYNHARIEEFLELEIRRRRRTGESVAFVMIDIDHFKDVNDRYGHQAGDDVLRRFARILEENVREGDVVGRYGGEEFSILLGSAGPDVPALCERIRVRVEAEIFESGPHRISLTTSLGWAVLRPERLAPVELVQRADRALYEAKRLGRNRVSGGQA